MLTVGIDEAGRGALAGPVVAAACVLPLGANIPVGIHDSKQMSPAERDASYEWIIEHCLCGVGIVDNRVIDRIGILAATEQAMQEAVAQIAKFSRDLYLLVDGRDAFWFDHPHSSIVRGDESEPAISAASIVAKVTRDRHMVELDSKFANYGFAQHKGYGTPEHYKSIEKHSACPLHRVTFLRKFYGIALP